MTQKIYENLMEDIHEFIFNARPTMLELNKLLTKLKDITDELNGALLLAKDENDALERLNMILLAELGLVDF